MYVALPISFSLGLMLGLMIPSRLNGFGQLLLGGGDAEARIRKLEVIAQNRASEIVGLREELAGLATANQVDLGDLHTEDKLGTWLQRTKSVCSYLQMFPDLAIPEMKYLAGRDWLDVTKGKQLEVDSDYRQVLSELRAIAKRATAQKLSEVLAEQSTRKPGEPPPTEQSIRTALEEGVGKDVLDRYELSRQTNDSAQRPGDHWVLTEAAPADPVWETSISVTDYGIMTVQQVNGPLLRQIPEAIRHFRSLNGKWPSSLSDIEYAAASSAESTAASAIFSASILHAQRSE